MYKFIIVSFMALGLAFYTLSGGSSFVPEERIVVAAAQDPEQIIAPDTQDVAVSRSNAASLIVLNPSVTLVAPPNQIALDQDIRSIVGSRGNLRQGPGTDFAVVNTLNGGTKAEVLEVNIRGWAHVEVVSTGQTGWVAARLLSDDGRVAQAN